MTINNEQLRRDNDILKIDNTRLRTNNDAMKNENMQLKVEIGKQRDQIGQLRTEVDMIKADNSNQLKTENDDLSRCTGVTKPQPIPRAKQQPKVSQ